MYLMEILVIFWPVCKKACWDWLPLHCTEVHRWELHITVSWKWKGWHILLKQHQCFFKHTVAVLSLINLSILFMCIFIPVNYWWTSLAGCFGKQNTFLFLCFAKDVYFQVFCKEQPAGLLTWIKPAVRHHAYTPLPPSHCFLTLFTP